MTKLNSRIFIVLATYNGQAFLADQIDSLLNQTEGSWTLLIRDDGSVDGTLTIINDYARRDERIQVLTDGDRGHHSTLGNFSCLLNAACRQGAEYVFCCDQDDVWESGKLKAMLVCLKQVEGEDITPCLVHHDLAVVNDSLVTIADSFVELMQLLPTDQQNPQRLISRNEVTGCAMACNRALLEIALPISDQAMMHDWWLALTAGYFGRLSYMPEKLVKYRQHGGNVIGAKSFWHGLNPFTNWFAGWHRGDKEFIASVKQARGFRQAMDKRFDKSSEVFIALELFCDLETASRQRRLRTLRQCGLWRSHWLLNVVLVIRMLLLPRASD